MPLRATHKKTGERRGFRDWYDVERAQRMGYIGDVDSWEWEDWPSTLGDFSRDYLIGENGVLLGDQGFIPRSRGKPGPRGRTHG